MKSDELVEEVRKVAKNVYEELGGGFKEIVYRNAMAVELEMEKGKREVEENFEIYYDDGDYDSIVVEGGLDKLKRYKLKDGLLDADVPEKVVDKILKRWDQDSELHKDYGKLTLMIERYIQDLKKVNGSLLQQTLDDLCALGRQYDNSAYDPKKKEKLGESDPVQRTHLRVPHTTSYRTLYEPKLGVYDSQDRRRHNLSGVSSSTSSNLGSEVGERDRIQQKNLILHASSS